MSRAPQRLGLAAWLIAGLLGSCSPRPEDKLLIANKTPFEVRVHVGTPGSPTEPHYIYKVPTNAEYPIEYASGAGCFSCFPNHEEPFAQTFHDGITIKADPDKEVHLPFKQLRSKVTHDGHGRFRLEIKPSDL